MVIADVLGGDRLASSAIQTGLLGTMQKCPNILQHIVANSRLDWLSAPNEFIRMVDSYDQPTGSAQSYPQLSVYRVAFIPFLPSVWLCSFKLPPCLHSTCQNS
jgi:hypothetical protein